VALIFYLMIGRDYILKRVRLSEFSFLVSLGINTRQCILACLSTLVVLFSSHTISAQTAEAKFGQNRVQYKDFAWQFYESDHFITYFYPGGQDLAKYVIKSAEDNALAISDLLNYKYRGKIDIIVYNTINELNQTNIGIYDPDQNQGGTAKLPDNKMFVYFNGDHGDLDRQIREGIARLYVNKQTRGGTVGEKIVNAVALNLPDWYKQGLISYLGESWNANMEDRLRDGLMSGRYKRLNKLSPEEAAFVGHSIWHYVEEAYGKNAVGNLQYLVRINRSVDNGFYFALGTNLNETLQGWYKYYIGRYNNEIKFTNPRENQDLVKKKNRKETDYYQPRISADGRYIAYASNNIGRLKIHLIDLEKKKKKVIFRTGWRTKTLWTDESTPLIAFNPKGDKIGFIFDKKNVVRFGEYSIKKQKGKPWKEFHRIEKFSKVTSFSYADAKTLAFSAVRNSQTDVFLYTIASQTVKQITNDYFDEFDPVVVMVDSIRGVVFASNRTDDTLRKEKYESQTFDKQRDLFFYDLDDESNALYRITNTPNANESYPQPFNDKYFSYLSEANGIRNQYLSTLEEVFDHNQKTYHFHNKESNEDDSISIPESMDYTQALDTSVIDIRSVTKEQVYRTQGKTFQLSNFSSNIMEQNMAPDKGVAIDRVLRKGVYEFYKYDISTSNPDLKKTYIQTDYMKRRNNIMLSEDSVKKVLKEKKQAEVEAKQNHIQKIYSGQDFQSEYDYGVKLFDWDSVAAANKALSPIPTTGATSGQSTASSGFVFHFSKVRPYFVRFMVDKFIAQLDNDPLITMYQPFDRSNPGYMYQPLNILLKVGITDLMEDYKVYGGLTFPIAGSSGFSFTDLGYFLVYENLKKRWDKKFTFYHQSMSSTASTYVPFYNTLIPPQNLPNDVGQVDYSVKTTYLSAEFKYPFDVFHRIGLTAGYRNDRYIFKSLDTFSLNLPTYSTNWVFLRTEYVYDNTIDVMTDIRNGFRAKAFFEFHKEFPTQEEGGVKVPAWNNAYFTEMGFDARYYLKIYHQMILASRASFATSLGNDKMIHYLGGLDNSLLTIKSGNNPAVQAPIDPNTNFVYQTVESPMRGFTANSRNGSSYALINAELRVPIFTMFMNHPSKSSFVRDFMLVGFLDCGTAWDGISPFSNNNPLFTTTYQNVTSVVTVQQYKTPVILGTGFGFRTSLLGYFIKLDVAWGLDTGVWSDKPVYYLSFGHDF
jgi:Tol biopolymer transport system component